MEGQPADEPAESDLEATALPASAAEKTPGFSVVKQSATKPPIEPPVDPQRPLVETAAFKSDAQQSILLRYFLSIGIFVLLCRENAAVLDVFDQQGRGVYHLDSWLIGLLITVVFVQTAYILRVIVVHLFPLGDKGNPPPVPGATSK